MDTVKIKPSHPSQGDFVVVNKEDFDPEKHELLTSEAPASDAPRRGRPPKAE